MSAISIQLGQDADVLLVNTSSGVTYTFSITGGKWIGAYLADFQADPVNNTITSSNISGTGYDTHRTERKGWKGSLTCNRKNGLIERIEILAHNKYHAGQPEDRWSIHLKVQDADGTGSVSEYEFTNCTLMVSKGGNYKSGDETQITLEFMADDCVDQVLGALGV